MAFHNPFIKDGLIKFPDNGSLVKHVERWAKVRGDKVAYRFVDFSTERDGVERDLNWADFGARNKAVGARLQQVTQPGDRVAILCPQNLEYLVAFFGTLYAGRIAVPLFDPTEPGHVGRLHAVLDDCQPSAILTTTDGRRGRPQVLPQQARQGTSARHRRRRRARRGRRHLGAGRGRATTPSPTCSTPRARPASRPACRSPTSTWPPTCVQVIEALDGEEGDRGVSWLPFFHDMGLITALVSPMIGHYVTFMTPAAFVRRPGRWIREMARKPDDTGGVISVAPNFAFDHAAARGVPKDGEPPLDLSNVKCILNGSEPISAATVRRFNEAFSPFGFQPQAIKPSYGLAEATLFVSTTPTGEPPKIIYVDRDELEQRTASSRCPRIRRRRSRRRRRGKVGVAEWAVIVDAETATELPDGQIGEIWISGQNMGTGYWGKPEETRRDVPEHPEVADQPVARRRRDRRRDLGPHRRPTAPSTTASCYITGRVKDLVIIDGRNHYPQDLEYSAQEATKALRTGFVAAFSVPANQLPDEVFDNAHSGLKRDPADTSEQLVIVGERAPGAHKLEHGPDRRRHPRRDRGAARGDRARRAADPGRRDPADVERQDRPPGLPVGVSRRQPAQRQDGQRLPGRDGLTPDYSNGNGGPCGPACRS